MDSTMLLGIQMNPLMLYRSLPYIIIVVLIAALSWVTNLYIEKRDQYAALTASVAALGEAAKSNVEKIQKLSAENLETVRDHYEKLVPAVRDGAVAAYKLRHPNAGRCPVPGATPGEQVADGTLEEPLLDITLIQEAASDANKLAAWQE